MLLFYSRQRTSSHVNWSPRLEITTCRLREVECGPRVKSGFHCITLSSLWCEICRSKAYTDDESGSRIRDLMLMHSSQHANPFSYQSTAYTDGPSSLHDVDKMPKSGHLSLESTNCDVLQRRVGSQGRHMYRYRVRVLNMNECHIETVSCCTESCLLASWLPLEFVGRNRQI